VRAGGGGSIVTDATRRTDRPRHIGTRCDRPRGGLCPTVGEIRIYSTCPNEAAVATCRGPHLTKQKRVLNAGSSCLPWQLRVHDTNGIEGLPHLAPDHMFRSRSTAQAGVVRICQSALQPISSRRLNTQYRKASITVLWVGWGRSEVDAFGCLGTGFVGTIRLLNGSHVIDFEAEADRP